MKSDLPMVARASAARLLAALLLAVSPASAARAQEAAQQQLTEPAANVTRIVDAYGSIGHCDETARLDNFAIELHNRPNTQGYLLIYAGKSDLPARIPGLLMRAADYLTQTRGIEAERVKVVEAGYRKERTTELWLVADGDPAPEPKDTIEVVRDPGKPYQWDSRVFEVEQVDDMTPEAKALLDEATADEAEGVDAAAAGSAEIGEGAGAATVEVAEAESAEDAEWLKLKEKYQITIESRKLFESPEPEDAPVEGTQVVSLWWDVDRYVEKLKEEPEGRACLIYYSDAAVEPAKIQEFISQAKRRLEGEYGLPPERIVLIDGGSAEDANIELWIVPKNAPLPQPGPAGKKMRRHNDGGDFDNVG